MRRGSKIGKLGKSLGLFCLLLVFLVTVREVRLAWASDQFTANCNFPYTGQNAVNQALTAVDNLFQPGCTAMSLKNNQGAGAVGNGFGAEIYNTAPAAGTASISATTMLASATLGTYRMCFTVDQTVLGTSCSTASTIQVNAIWQDPNAASAQTVAIPLFTTSGTTVGVLGVVPLTSGPMCFVFRAKAGTAIQYSTTFTAGTSCSPAPTVQVFPVLEAM